MGRPNLFYFNTTKIIAINFVFYMLALVAMMASPKVIEYIALRPDYILQGKYLWTIITSMFMHGSLFHLLANMMSLFFLGSFLEKIIGRKRFLAAYMISGIIASLFFVLIAYLFNTDLNASAVGASGAIFGIAGMLAVLTPKMPVYVLFIPIAMPMWLGSILILILLWGISAAFGLSIGNVAHLGGLLVGLAYAFYLKLKHPRTAKIIANHFT
jgi:hypothetical protein